VSTVQNSALLRAPVRHGVKAPIDMREDLFEDGARHSIAKRDVEPRATAARSGSAPSGNARRPEAVPPPTPAVGCTNQSPENAAMTRLCTRLVSTPRPANARNF